jgi:hypothetical protein
MMDYIYGLGGRRLAGRHSDHRQLAFSVAEEIAEQCDFRGDIQHMVLVPAAGFALRIDVKLHVI